VNPQHLGRIYRVVPADRPAPRAPKVTTLTNAQWVGRLAHPTSFWRETAQRTLVERRDAATIPAIRDVALKSGSPLARVHALWTLDGMDAPDHGAVMATLAHASPVVRVAGIRASEILLDGDRRDELLTQLKALARDPSPDVQLQAMLTLGAVDDPELDVELAEVTRAYPKNTFLSDALFSGLANHEFRLLERLSVMPAWRADDDEANRILSGLARGVFGSRQLPAIERVIAIAGKAAGEGGGRRAVALLDGLVPTTGSSRRPVQLRQQPAGWAELESNPTAKTRLTRLKDIIVWPGKPGANAVTEVKPLSPEQKARFDAGRLLYSAVCGACHQGNGRGLDGLAPPLLDSEWVLGPAERAVRIVLHGVRGPIRVLGRVHTGDMPAFGAALDDEKVASILTYLRREWGHTASPVEPEEIKAIRAATAGQTGAWSPEELMQVK
jgi:mono/diheme cytochrome c family protein